MSLRNLLLSRSIFVSQSIDVIYYFQSFCLTTTQQPPSEYSLQSNPSIRTENFYQVTALVIFVTYVIKNLYKKQFHLRHQLPIHLGCHQVETYTSMQTLSTTLGQCNPFLTQDIESLDQPQSKFAVSQCRRVNLSPFALDEQNKS